MTDASFDEQRRLLGILDELASIKDDELDRLLDGVKSEIIRALRSGIAEIEQLPAKRRPDQEARRRAQVEWFAFLLASLGALQ